MAEKRGNHTVNGPLWLATQAAKQPIIVQRPRMHAYIVSIIISALVHTWNEKGPPSLKTGLRQYADVILPGRRRPGCRTCWEQNCLGSSTFVIAILTMFVSQTAAAKSVIRDRNKMLSFDSNRENTHSHQQNGTDTNSRYNTPSVSLSLYSRVRYELLMPGIVLFGGVSGELQSNGGE